MRKQEINNFNEAYLLGKVILIDKPLEWTSFDVVRKVRNLLGVRKIGHAGTLDPLASGLLILCTGKYTKKINEYMGMPKEYTGTITLGATTASYDLESALENEQNTRHITEQMVVAATKQFTGEILQTPPIFSAIKQAGKPVYLLARKGQDVVLEPRPITIYSFDIEQVINEKVHFRIVCSTGTYIRSIANDFGQALGVGGYLSGLRRTKIGDFSVTDAYSMPAFEQYIQHTKITV